MARLDDLEHVNRELEAFRAQAKEALKTFDELEKVVSEFPNSSRPANPFRRVPLKRLGF